MKLTPIELNIRSSWAINAGVASMTEDEKASIDFMEKIELRAKAMVILLDKIKVYIEPPLQEQGKSKQERKEDAKHSAEIDLGLSEMEETDFHEAND